jgi:hypothetical protein
MASQIPIVALGFSKALRRASRLNATVCLVCCSLRHVQQVPDTW